jgi:uncharacterized membrane protein required for colicin V production
MSIVDAIIILIILSSAFLGFKRGFTKELVCFLGFFAIIILAFILKNPLSTILYEYLPFFKFSGLFKGATSLNIILYEVISFFIVVSILLIIFKVIMFATTIFEKLLKATILLGLPSKILGLIVGIIEGITWSFIILYILSLPLFNIDVVNKSKIKDLILNNTPILSVMTQDTIKASKEFNELKEEYKKDNNMKSEEFDLKTINILLKYKIVSIDSINTLIKKDKINIKNIETILDKYEED